MFPDYPATSEQIGIIDNESTRTVYLVDGDEAGRAIKAKILEAGVDASRIVDLPSLNGQDTVLEDYISTDVYIRCINADLTMSGCPAITEDHVPRPNRPKQVEAWCQQHKHSPPSKRSVAYRIVDEKHDFDIVDETAIEAVRELHKRLATALELEQG